MADIVYTAHAKQRMILRGISDEMVRMTLEMPEEKGTGYRNRSLAYRRFSRGRVKVVYVEEKDRSIVISAMWED